MELGWNSVIQAVVLAVCTWYMRRGSVRDSQNLKSYASSHADVDLVRKELQSLKHDFEIFKLAYFKNNPVVDHRGPSKEK
jgi:hypothetical protein